MSNSDDMEDLFGDGEEEAEDNQQQPEADEEDLFGEGDDDAEAQESPEEEHKGYRDSGATGDPINIEAPLINLPAADKLHLLNLRNNLIAIQPKPFDPDTYEPEPVYISDQEGIKKPNTAEDNIIRWRWQQSADGTLEMASNARFVRWEDGTQQLLIGDEAFDVVTQDISQNSLYLYTVGGIIQGQAQLTSRMAFRPASFQSKSHQRVREKAVRATATKATKVATHASTVDPEKEKAEREKQEEQKARMRQKLSSEQERVQRRYNMAAGQRKLNASYLEAMDDEYEDFAQQQQRRRDDDDDGMAGQRARSALQRPRGLSPAEEAAAAQRLESAKRPAPAAAAAAQHAKPPKRQRTADGGSDVEVAAEAAAAAAEEDARDRARAKARRGVVLSDDEDD